MLNLPGCCLYLFAWTPPHPVFVYLLATLSVHLLSFSLDCALLFPPLSFPTLLSITLFSPLPMEFLAVPLVSPLCRSFPLLRRSAKRCSCRNVRSLIRKPLVWMAQKLPSMQVVEGVIVVAVVPAVGLAGVPDLPLVLPVGKSPTGKPSPTPFVKP